MTENGLTKAISEFVEKATADYRLPVKNGAPRSPRVFNGYLPPKRSGSDDDFPCIVVRPDSGTVNEEQTEVKVSLIVCCYTEEFDGYEHCINIFQRIKAALTSMPNGILDGKYVLNLPIKWDNLAEQPYPQWQLDIETNWAFNTPQADF